ncbi:MAG: hypothetical protein HZB44_06435 [Actinobacteria bacterium]|nr:hypothetical protein [Actinomycetota bacterium]
MSKFTLIAVLALVMLLVGASAVFAQDAPVRQGNRMAQTPAAPATPGATAPDAQPAPQGDPVCPMGGPGPGAMGQGAMMNGENMDQMREAMENGTWEEMRATCQQAWERNQSSDDGTEPSSATRGGSTRNTAT